MGRYLKSPTIILILILVALLVLPGFFGQTSSARTLTFLEFQQMVEQGKVVSPVTIKTKDLVVEGRLKTGEDFKTGFTQDFEIVSFLSGNNVDFETDPQATSGWAATLVSLAPTVLILLFLLFILGRAQAGGSQVMDFGKAKAKKITVDQPKVTFADVAGVDEAVEELQEIKDFLRSPAKFRSLGAKIPTGVLLYGPPGTGKTLLARAVAGEAGVPFFSISGSDFVEIFVGVGASRVRNLFEQAKENQPSIVFIDEIDAVGRQRGAGLGGGHDEREQTLNQLLVEMDGFEPNDNVIVMAGTNRPDILDPALLRPGRFDRQIMVDRPDRNGRRLILEVHTRDKPLAPDVDLDSLAARTPGLTGADLANLVNEAALLAARHGEKQVSMEELEEASLRVIAGPEKKSRLISKRERLITAYHETGHALVAHFLPKTDPVVKVSIVSRGQALGYTLTLPTEDKFMVEKTEIMDKLAHMLAGRVAEEIRFGDITTGAANDLQKATETARRMITQYGMSEELGPITFGHDPSQPFVGREIGSEQEYSEETARRIDVAIAEVIDQAKSTATRILTQRRALLDTIAGILMERETIEQEEFQALAAGEDPAAVLARLDEKEAARKTKKDGAVSQKKTRSRTVWRPGPLGQAGDELAASNPIQHADQPGS